MNLPLGEWTLVPAAVVLAVALAIRPLRRHPDKRIALARRWAPLVVAGSIFAGLWIFEGRLEPLPVIFAILYAFVSPGRSTVSTVSTTWTGLRRAMPLLLGAVSAAVTFWVGSVVGFAPRYHDEYAYLLQAGIFAEGKWAEPSPPLPEFFEQFHILVVPSRASKYPPGHSLLLAPGVALGVPAAVPLLLVGATAALLFALTRRVAGEREAFFCWLIWTCAPGGLRFRSSYFSELTTSFLWLAIWWAVIRWKETDRSIWLAVAAGGVSVGAITRPLTMLVFAVPLAAVILYRILKRRAFRELAIAAAAAAIGLVLVPIWSHETIGSWSTTPLTAYTKAYLPFDVPGFETRTSSAQRELPDCMRDLPAAFLRLHREHRVPALGGILRERVGVVLRDSFGLSQILFAFALLGATLMTREGALALVTAFLLLVGYLSYPHFSVWSIYYLETLAVLSAAAGIGLSAAIGSLPDGLARAATALVFIALTVFGSLEVADARSQKERSGPRLVRMRGALASLPMGEKSVVFVRCAPGADPHESLVQNGPDLENQRVWFVHDLGDHDRDLRRRVPDRAAYLYDETRGALTRLEPEGDSRP